MLTQTLPAAYLPVQSPVQSPVQKESTIFVVDDEAANLEVIDLLLARENYQILAFDDPCLVEAAVPLMLPDIILLDVMMPGIDGIELCNRLKGNLISRHIPIIMITALSGQENLARCLEAGADDFISKPFNGTELRARIRSLLRIKQQYDQVTQLLVQREAALTLREDLSNMIIHDLRNPLANIQLSCQILRLYDVPDRANRISPKIDQIEYASHRLETMIDSLLITAKLESGKLQLQCRELDLVELINITLVDFKPIAIQQEIRLVANLPQSHVPIVADASLLRRVLDNLLANALKFAPSHSTVTIVVTLDDATIDLQIQDQGQGIQPECREQIFAKYAIGEHRPEVPQIGLGLAFCQMAIAAHGGSIDVGDNHPRGSIFTIKLPHDRHAPVMTDTWIEPPSF